MTTPDIGKKKRQVVIVYFIVFFGVFIAATIVAWQRRIEDARNAMDVAPPSSLTPVAPVASAR